MQLQAAQKLLFPEGSVPGFGLGWQGWSLHQAPMSQGPHENTNDIYCHLVDWAMINSFPDVMEYCKRKMCVWVLWVCTRGLWALRENEAHYGVGQRSATGSGALYGSSVALLQLHYRIRFVGKSKIILLSSKIKPC